MSKSDLMNAIHSTASDFYKTGVMDKQTMQELKKMCSPKQKASAAKEENNQSFNTNWSLKQN